MSKVWQSRKQIANSKFERKLAVAVRNPDSDLRIRRIGTYEPKGYVRAGKAEAWRVRAIQAEKELKDLQRGAQQPAPKPTAPDFYESDAWRALRYAVLKESKGCCELCGASKATGAIVQVDHIKPRSKFPALSLVRSNLQVLCRDCNLGKGNKDAIDWREQQLRVVRDKVG